MAPRDDPEITSISIWYDGCNSTQQDFISHAWDDAINMAKAISGIDYDHDPAAIEYFGPSFLNKDAQWRILSVFTHIATYPQKSNINPLYWRVNAFCGRDNDRKTANACYKKENPQEWSSVAAYEWNSKNKDGTGGNYDQVDAYINVMYCDLFFELPSLDDNINNMKYAPYRQKYSMDNYRSNRGT